MRSNWPRHDSERVQTILAGQTFAAHHAAMSTAETILILASGNHAMRRLHRRQISGCAGPHISGDRFATFHSSFCEIVHGL
jgi:hypothetical protein